MTPAVFHEQPVQGCHSVCCSGFYRVERISKDLAGPSLTNAIHPLFAPERFAKEFDHEVLKPSLRLATHLIEATLPFFHSVFFARMVDIGSDPYGRMSYQLCDEVAILTDSQRRQTKNVLMSLTPHISFRLTEAPAEGEEDLEGSGTSYGPRLSDDEDLTIVIDLARRLHSDAVSVCEDTDYDVVSGHWILFDIARTLLHELAHAFMLLWRPIEHHDVPMDPFVFFSQSKFAEEGYEWEVRAFGGIVEPIAHALPDHLLQHLPDTGNLAYTLVPSNGEQEWQSGMGKMIVLTDWPNLAMVERYEANSWCMGRRGSLPWVHVRWNVDFERIYRLFHDSFWNHPMPPGSMVLPKHIGARYYGCQVAGHEGLNLPYGTGLILAPGVVHPFVASEYVHTVDEHMSEDEHVPAHNAVRARKR